MMDQPGPSVRDLFGVELQWPLESEIDGPFGPGTPSTSEDAWGWVRNSKPPNL